MQLTGETPEHGRPREATMRRVRQPSSVRLITTLLAAAGIASAAEARPRAVIELFTSQGCSSCPPADELLATIARDPDVIALSFPVDYWDRLGWKDTLARHAFTERQVAYAGVRGDGEVYTPQAVVNGKAHAVGSRRSEIERAVAATAAAEPVAVGIERRADGVIVSVGPSNKKGAARGTVVMLPFVASRDVAIGRGENARRKVTYTNVVREILPIADWSGTPLERAVPKESLEGYDGVVVLLQEGSPAKPGAILGAARAALR
jgi:hypothetical protein